MHIRPFVSTASSVTAGAYEFISLSVGYPAPRALSFRSDCGRTARAISANRALLG